MAMSMAAGQSKIGQEITSMWNNYVNLETYMEDENKQRDIDMQEEYAHWSKVKPKLTKSADGKFSVSGISLNR